MSTQRPTRESTQATQTSVRNSFSSAAATSARLLGSPWAFAGAAVLVVLWALLGKHFNFSDTWQLVINTGTSIATFLMVFLIQNTQNRDARAIHLKLDEMIRSTQDADNRMMKIEVLTDEELEILVTKYDQVRSEYERRHPDLGPRKTASRPVQA